MGQPEENPGENAGVLSSQGQTGPYGRWGVVVKGRVRKNQRPDPGRGGNSRNYVQTKKPGSVDRASKKERGGRLTPRNKKAGEPNE